MEVLLSHLCSIMLHGKLPGLNTQGWHRIFLVRQGWGTGELGELSTSPGMYSWVLLRFTWAQLWDSSELSMGPVRTPG